MPGFRYHCIFLLNWFEVLIYDGRLEEAQQELETRHGLTEEINSMGSDLFCTRSMGIRFKFWQEDYASNRVFTRKFKNAFRSC